MFLLRHAGLVQKCFLLGVGWGGVGTYSRVGAYEFFGLSGWAVTWGGWLIE